MNANILEARHLNLDYPIKEGTFRWSKFRALHDVSFAVRSGETLGILGRNGCGKSTLLRILAGIVNPSAGSIICHPEIRRSLLTLGLGFRFDLSGRDNAVLSLMYQGSSKKDALASLPEICEFAELGDFFEQPVRTYSTGMRARLGFAAAMKTDVELLLIDEILSVGDEHFQQRARAVMLDKIHGHQAVVFVSHNGVQINAICNRAIWLESGRIGSSGEPQRVVDDYRAFLRTL